MENNVKENQNRPLVYLGQWFKKKTTKRFLFFLVLIYFLPLLMLFYLVCGVLDVIRNKKISWFLLHQYFLGHGSFTWLLSPVNLLLDFLTIPYWNKGVYALTDLPKSYQDELSTLLATMDSKDLVTALEKKLANTNREMIFFKWYGKNIHTSIFIPEFHRNYDYISTIGVSVFNKRKSTSRHFGPIRMTLRVLYNINPMQSDKAYIEVGDKRNYWNKNKLFIFDDTLLHQSINESDELRYCAFIDILRPSLSPRLFRLMVSAFGWFFIKVNRVFYNGWAFIK